MARFDLTDFEWLGRTSSRSLNRKTRPVFSGYLYKCRDLVERFFNKLNRCRAIATRYDKRADNFLASIQVTSICTWLRD